MRYHDFLNKQNSIFISVIQLWEKHLLKTKIEDELSAENRCYAIAALRIANSSDMKLSQLAITELENAISLYNKLRTEYSEELFQDCLPFKICLTLFDQKKSIEDSEIWHHIVLQLSQMRRFSDYYVIAIAREIKAYLLKYCHNDEILYQLYKNIVNWDRGFIFPLSALFAYEICEKNSSVFVQRMLDLHARYKYYNDIHENNFESKIEILRKDGFTKLIDFIENCDYSSSKINKAIINAQELVSPEQTYFDFY